MPAGDSRAPGLPAFGGLAFAAEMVGRVAALPRGVGQREGCLVAVAERCLELGHAGLESHVGSRYAMRSSARLLPGIGSGATIAFPGAVPRGAPSRTRVPILIGPPAFPQGSMDGSDLAGAVGCANAHGPTPQLGRPKGGSLPSPAARPVRPRPTDRRSATRCGTGR